MSQKNLYLTAGVSGSGKSTVLRKIISKNPEGVIVSRDFIRFALLGENDKYFDKEKEVFKEYVHRIQNALDSGKDVYADATHLNLISRRKLLSNLKLDDVKIHLLYFKVPLEICLERNQNRSGLAYVPEEVIKRQFKNLTFPDFNEIDTLHYYSISTITEKGEYC